MKKVILLATAIAFARLLPGKTEVDESHSDEFAHRTSKSSLVFEATPDSRTIEVTVDTVSNGGRLCWSLVDPLGARRLRGCGSSGHVMGKSGTLEALPGRWVLSFEYFDSTGESHVRWKIR